MAESTRASGRRTSSHGSPNSSRDRAAERRSSWMRTPRWRSFARPRRTGVDVLVVGNLGMSGRREFLLGNVPNRVEPQRPVHRDHRQHGRAAAERVRPTDAGIGRRPRRRGRSPAGAGDHDPTVLAKHGIRELFSRGRRGDEDSTEQRARRFRQALEELGPTFAKLGQMLSTRPGPGAAGVHQGARHAAGQRAAPDARGSRARDGAGARRAVGGRVRDRSCPSRWRRAPSPRSIAPRSPVVSVWS